MKQFSLRFNKMKRASITELAKLAKVSETTVSRAFNKHPYIKKEVYERIMRVAREINYIPRSSDTKKRIGIIVNSFESNRLNAYSSNMLLHLSLHCGLNNCSMEIILAKDLHLIEENFLKAIITFQLIHEASEEFKKFRHAQFISVNSIIEGFPCISSDDFQGMELAVNHMATHGHKKIALILPNNTNAGSIKERKEGFCNAIQKCGFSYSPEMIGYLNNNPIEMTAKLVLTQKPDALIIAGEDMIHPVNYALNLLKINMPENLSVISYETAAVSEYMVPAHTTIAQNFDELAGNAVRLACEVLDGNYIDSSLRISIKNSLIQRDSVKFKKS